MNKDDYAILHHILTERMMLDCNSILWNDATTFVITGLLEESTSKTVPLIISNQGWDHLTFKYPKLLLSTRKKFNLWELVVAEYLTLNDQVSYTNAAEGTINISNAHLRRILDELKLDVTFEHVSEAFQGFIDTYCLQLLKLPRDLSMDDVWVALIKQRYNRFEMKSLVSVWEEITFISEAKESLKIFVKNQRD